MLTNPKWPLSSVTNETFLNRHSFLLIPSGKQWQFPSLIRRLWRSVWRSSRGPTVTGRYASRYIFQSNLTLFFHSYTTLLTTWTFFRKTGEDQRVLTPESGESSKVSLLCPTLDTDQTRRLAIFSQMDSRSSLFTMPKSWKSSWCTTGNNK